MNIISSYFNKRKSKKISDKERELVDDANSTYQIKEFNGEIWLTFNGHRCIPASLLKNEPLEVLKCLRELYIKNPIKINNYK